MQADSYTRFHSSKEYKQLLANDTVGSSAFGPAFVRVGLGKSVSNLHPAQQSPLHQQQLNGSPPGRTKLSIGAAIAAFESHNSSSPKNGAQSLMQLHSQQSQQQLARQQPLPAFSSDAVAIAVPLPEQQLQQQFPQSCEDPSTIHASEPIWAEANSGDKPTATAATT